MPAYLALAGTLLTALAAAGWKYVYDLRIARRRDRLERINAQLKYLYGPLMALDLAAKEAFADLKAAQRALLGQVQGNA
jgi:hypothetical protein